MFPRTWNKYTKWGIIPLLIFFYASWLFMCLWEYYYFLLDLKGKKNNTWGNPRVYQPAQIYVLILKYNAEGIIGKNTSFLQKEKLLGLWNSHLRSRYLLIKQHFLESIVFMRKWKFMRILLRQNESQLSPIFSCPKWISLSLQKCQRKATSGHLHHLYPTLPLTSALLPNGLGNDSDAGLVIVGSSSYLPLNNPLGSSASLWVSSMIRLKDLWVSSMIRLRYLHPDRTRNGGTEGARGWWNGSPPPFFLLETGKWMQGFPI